ncbi:MYXO-CTERM sorting domain-containing protein [Nannocystis pusilla]|uniref:MYXO-CTERM sorting domain-containing protein n=1 Tax=Nannocystis pusilla TaxID=889268 RepID=A0A9X3EYD7_9BACT|nr:MYXO-CTERM sorting domain-containing protein [Nannocystis pusilla]
MRAPSYRSSSRFALLAGTWLLLRPDPASACKPPQFVAERLDFTLVAARRAGQPVSLEQLPPTLRARSTPYAHLLVRDIGYLKLIEATRPLPRPIERYIRRQRRIAKPICAILVYREPAVPGRYAPDLDPQYHESDDPRWTALWPLDVPGVVELTPHRDRLLVTIERPDAPLELEYRLTHATFSSCDVTSNEDRPPAVLALLALALRRRRRE